jgi:hypothetical protein
MESLRAEIVRAQEFCIKAEGELTALKKVLDHAAALEKDREIVFNEP